MCVSVRVRVCASPATVEPVYIHTLSHRHCVRKLRTGCGWVYCTYIRMCQPHLTQTVTTACLQCQAAGSRSHLDNGGFCTVD